MSSIRLVIYADALCTKPAVLRMLQPGSIVMMRTGCGIPRLVPLTAITHGQPIPPPA
jgi:hypothetical protein